MQLLLLLSALLSAFTGAVTGARTSAPQHVASSTVVAIVAKDAQIAVAAAQRPVQAVATLAMSALQPVSHSEIVTYLPKPYEGRRRE